MKETISKVKKKKPSEWEEIIANEVTDKELISKIYKQLHTRIIDDPIKNWDKELKRLFSKEDIQITNKHMKKMFNITHYQRNTNHNHNEGSSPTGQNGCYQKVYK